MMDDDDGDHDHDDGDHDHDDHDDIGLALHARSSEKILGICCALDVRGTGSNLHLHIINQINHQHVSYQGKV